MVTFEIGWILKTQNGRDYLNEIQNCEDLNIYKVKTLKMLIEFLYDRFKKTLLRVLLPLHVMQLIVYYGQVFVLEMYIGELWDN